MSHTESPDFDRMAEGRQIAAEASSDRAEIQRLRGDLKMLQSKAEHARTKAIIARSAASRAVEYADDCLTLIARMQAGQ